MTKKVVIRLYSKCDLDLLYLSYNPIVKFSQIAKAALKSYANNAPFLNLPDMSGGGHYNIPKKIITKEVTLYLDSQEDKKVINMLSKTKNNTLFIKYVVRYYAYKSSCPKEDAISDIFLRNISDSRHLVESNSNPVPVPINYNTYTPFVQNDTVQSMPNVDTAPTANNKTKIDAVEDELVHENIQIGDELDYIADNLIDVGGF